MAEPEGSCRLPRLRRLQSFALTAAVSTPTPKHPLARCPLSPHHPHHAAPGRPAPPSLYSSGFWPKLLWTPQGHTSLLPRRQWRDQRFPGGRHWQGTRLVAGIGSLSLLISHQGGIIGAAQSRDTWERRVDARCKSRAETREAGDPRATAAAPNTVPLSSWSPRAPRPTSSPARRAAGSPGCARDGNGTGA